jgi:hypothetical protein
VGKISYAVDDVKVELVNLIDVNNQMALSARTQKMNRYYLGTVNGLMIALQFVDAGERYDKRDSGAVEMRQAKDIIQEVRNASS